MNIFYEFLERPIWNLLVFLYDVIPGRDIGIAIVIVTVIVRLILYPSFRSSLRAQRAMQALQPKLNEAREKHKENKQAQMEAMMALYKEHKVSPLTSCLPLIVQLPLIFALFQVLNFQLPKGTIEGLYSFVENPGTIDPIAFGIVNVIQPNMVLAAIAAILQYFQTKMMQPKNMAASTDITTKLLQKQMLYFLPIVTFVVALTLPAGLPLYWAVTTIFAIFQQRIIIRESHD